MTGKWEGIYDVAGTLNGTVLDLDVVPFSQDGIHVTGWIRGTISGDSFDGRFMASALYMGFPQTRSGALVMTRSSGSGFAARTVSGATLLQDLPAGR